MANLSLEAAHLLKLMRLDRQNRFEPLRPKILAAMRELERHSYVKCRVYPNGAVWTLTLLGYDPHLTR